jgi:hypothetical protein
MTAGLDEVVASRAAGSLHRLGAAHLPEVLTPEGRSALLERARRAAFVLADARVGRVRQTAEIAVLPAPWRGEGTLNRLGRELRDWLRTPSWGPTHLSRFEPDEATYMRYPAGGGGLSPHLDGRRYGLAIAVFSLCGEARLLVCADRAARSVLGSIDCRPGDLVLLRASGFAGCADGRPLHAISASSDRLSLTLRMSTAANDGVVSGCAGNLGCHLQSTKG